MDLKRAVIFGLMITAGLLINCVVVITGMPAAHADASSCSVSTILVNSCRPWLGGTANSYPQAANNLQSQIQYHEQRIGRPLDIVHSYHAVGSNTLSAADVYYATRAQTMLYTDWNPTGTWGDIANQDAGIDQMAASIKSLGSTRIFLNLWHEPENDVSPGGDANCPAVNYKGSAGTVADYRNMWRYTESRFTADGVNNVVWVMDYQNYSAFDCLVPDLWPGNDLIDWVMFNAYDNATLGDFTSPVSRFIGVLNAANSATDNFASKPWGIAEWGSTGTPAQDISFYDSAKTSLDNNTFPQLKAYLVYDSDGGTVPANQDLRVGYDANHTPDATKASHYAAFANDPALSGDYSGPPPLPDNTAPTVSLDSPSDGSQVSGSVTVTGTSADDRGVTNVALLVDGRDSGLTASQPGSSPTFVWDSTTAGNGRHTLQLVASDAAGNTGQSATITVTVANSDSQPPTAPTGLTVSAADPNEVDLAWPSATDNVGVDHYLVYRDGSVQGQTADASTTYADTTVAPSTSYSYQVLAVDAAGNVGPPSPTRVIVTPAPADVTAPTAPTGLTATPVAGSEIDLSWTASTDDTGVTGYRVYRDGKVATVTSATSWSDTGLADGSAHDYAVTAVDAAGNESKPSATVHATTADVTAPTTPTHLSATAVGPHEIDLAWTASSDNVGVTGYDVYRNGTLLATVGPGTSYADTSVYDATSYTYAVDAFDAAGNHSAVTAGVGASTTDGTAPSVPSGLKATASGTTVNLSWSAATDNVGVTGYAVYRNGVQVATALSTSYADTGLAGSTAYRYTVAAFDAAGNASAQSAPVTVSTVDTAPPTVPSGLRAAAAGGTTVNLSWSAATDNVAVAGYNVYRNGARIATLTGRSYADTSLTNATTYSYTVNAYDAAGNVSAQSTAVAVTTADTSAPTVPAKPSVTASAYNQVTVTWAAATDNVGVAGYRVYRAGTQIATVAGTTSYIDATVVAKTTYSYTVSAYDAAGNVSKQSTATSVTTPAAPDTTAPSAPTALKSTITTTKAVSLSWTASTDNVAVTGYWVYRNGTYLGTSTKARYTDSTAVQATTYSYTVKAYDAAGNASAYSTALVVTVPDATAPTAPSRLTLTPGTKSVTATWTASTDNVAVVGYYVYRNGAKVATVKAGTTYADKNLTTGTKYSYYVVAFDAANNLSPASPTVTAVAK